MIRWLKTPRSLLLVDAAGAAMTALATYFLLASERIATGLPVRTLHLMAIAATCFVAFDLASAFRAASAASALRIIAGLNVLYAVVTTALLIIHRSDVTGLGFIYFGVESVVLVALAMWELKVANAPGTW